MNITKIYKINNTYGGQEFLLVNHDTATLQKGCSRSTTLDFNTFTTDIEVATTKELKRLENHYKNILEFTEVK